MQIQLFSDLHIEFEELSISCEKADVVVLAGDIEVGIKGVEWIKRQNIKCPIIYVLGNHEYYKQSHPGLIRKVTEAAKQTNIHLLENKSITIGDVCFHGTTLWTDFELFGDPRVAGYECQQIMTDFKKIRKEPSYSKLRSIDVATIHHHSKLWLAQSLSQSVASQNVVVTHHAPSKKSIPEHYKTNIVSAAYASNMDDFIEQHQPDYWLHGHLHNSLDYKIGNCRVVCNPRGYSDERNPDFQLELLINV